MCEPIARLRGFLKRPFVRQVATVASGAALAQAIGIAFAPLVTRLYGPEAYGVLGAFTAMVTVLSPLATLTYPIAIVLPSNDTEALGIVRLSVYIAAVVAALMLLAVFLARGPIIRLFNLEAAGGYLLLVPLLLFLSAILNIVRQWAIRKTQFKAIAIAAVASAFVIKIVTVGIGLYFAVAAVLIVLASVAAGLHAALLYAGIRRASLPREASDADADARLPLSKLAARYYDYPLYRAPQALINAASQGLPTLVLAGVFGPSAAGFYSLARAVMGMPSGLIGQAVGDVFYPRVTAAAHAGENVTGLLLRATAALLAVGFVPFGLVVAFGPSLFGMVFGGEWNMAGEYARWLALFFYFNFINKPTVAAVPVLRLQKGLLVYEVFSTGSKVAGLLVGFYLYKSEIVAIALFSLLGVAAYAAMIGWIIVRSRRAVR